MLFAAEPASAGEAAGLYEAGAGHRAAVVDAWASRTWPRIAAARDGLREGDAAVPRLVRPNPIVIPTLGPRRRREPESRRQRMRDG